MNPAPPVPSAMLVLEDGRTFHGDSYGAPGETFGEAVFSTGMTGYQETLTDPSYHRQVVVMTAPHVGNTGMNDEDPESARIWVSGYVVRDPARTPSSWRSRRGLDDALREQGVVGISGVDTRALTRHLRERGAMRVGISTSETDPDALLARVLDQPAMSGADLAGEVTTPAAYVVPAVGERRFTVAALDLGIKGMTPALMAERGIEVHVLPSSATIDDVLATGADGVFFSNGPGDPATADLTTLTAVLERGIPYFGICFGNQLFGRALGFGTYKLTYGHRGINQPVIDRTSGKVEVTAHNHGFAVDAPLDRPTTTPYGEATVSHVCLNDDVVEGLELRDDAGHLRAFSVQYHPEAAAGPHDAAYLFDRFADLMGGFETVAGATSSTTESDGDAPVGGPASTTESGGDAPVGGPASTTANGGDAPVVEEGALAPVSKPGQAGRGGFETVAGATSSTTENGGDAPVGGPASATENDGDAPVVEEGALAPVSKPRDRRDV